MIELVSVLAISSLLLPPHLDHSPPSLLRRRIAAATLPFIFAPISSSSAADSYNYDAAASYDSGRRACPLAEALGLKSLRSTATGLCRGKRLEVGVGTGLNLPLYDAKVTASAHRCRPLFRHAARGVKGSKPATRRAAADERGRRLNLPTRASTPCWTPSRSACTATRRRRSRRCARVCALRPRRAARAPAVDGECGARLVPGRDCWRGEQARRQGLRLQPARRGARARGLEVVKRTEAVAGTVALLETRPKG